jgi:hypothetical protein
MNKEVIKGYFDWERRIIRINVIVTPVSSGFLLLLYYFKLIPKQIGFINYIILIVYLGLYSALFISILLYQQKKQEQANLKKLQEEMGKLSHS